MKKMIIMLFILLFSSVLLYAQDTMLLYKEGVLYEAIPRMKNIPVGKDDYKIEQLYKNATAFSDTEYEWGIKPFPIGYFVVDRFRKVTTYAKGVDEGGAYVSTSVQKKLVNGFYPNWFYLAVFFVWIFVIILIPKFKSISLTSSLFFIGIMPGTCVVIVWVLWEIAPIKGMDFWTYAAPNLLFFLLLLYKLIKQKRKLKEE